MGSKGFCHLINVEVETVNSEIICIRVNENVVGLGKCGEKEVKKSRGYTSSLRDSYSAMKGGRERKVVSTGDYTPF